MCAPGPPPAPSKPPISPYFATRSLGAPAALDHTLFTVFPSFPWTPEMIAHLMRGRATVPALSLVAAALSVGLVAPASRAQAPADLCANAPLIVGNHQYMATNLGASSDIAQ